MIPYPACTSCCSIGAPKTRRSMAWCSTARKAELQRAGASRISARQLCNQADCWCAKSIHSIERKLTARAPSVGPTNACSQPRSPCCFRAVARPKSAQPVCCPARCPADGKIVPDREIQIRQEHSDVTPAQPGESSMVSTAGCTRMAEPRGGHVGPQELALPLSQLPVSWVSRAGLTSVLPPSRRMSEKRRPSGTWACPAPRPPTARSPSGASTSSDLQRQVITLLGVPPGRLPTYDLTGNSRYITDWTCGK